MFEDNSRMIGIYKGKDVVTYFFYQTEMSEQERKTAKRL